VQHAVVRVRVLRGRREHEGELGESVMHG
jgi:hypothetical protein